jgi:hypothetical protein
MVNDVGTNLNCTIPGFGTTCDSGGKTVKIPAGSRMRLKIDAEGLGSAPETFLYFGFGV